MNHNNFDNDRYILLTFIMFILSITGVLSPIVFIHKLIRWCFDEK